MYLFIDVAPAWSVVREKRWVYGTDVEFRRLSQLISICLVCRYQSFNLFYVEKNTNQPLLSVQ